jgi:CubicO group peptidase (beta-lactamase class C family)
MKGGPEVRGPGRVPRARGVGRVLRRLIGLAGTLLVVLLFGLLWAFARVSAGFGAVVAAQHAFATGDPPATIAADHFRLPWGVGRFLKVELDPARRSARVRALGLSRCEAVWRDGLGAVRQPSVLALDLSWPPTPLPSVPWPEGGERGPSGLARDLEEALQERLAASFAAAPRATRAALVVQAGRLVAERYREDTGPRTPLLGWSMTKSFLATMVGRWIELGRIAGVEEPLEAPEWSAPDDPRRAITVEHLLRMSSGLAFDGGYTLPWSDSLQMLFVAPEAAPVAAGKALEHAPGSHWSYSDGSSNLLARFVQARAGDTLAEQVAFLRRELLEPLGMHTATLGVDPSGHWVGSSFLTASARDWARLGLLYLRDGVRGGRRLLPEGWVELVSRPVESSPHRVYGAHFWRYDPADPRTSDGRPAPAVLAGVLYAAGYDHQFLWIDRSRDALVVRLGRRDPGFDPEAFAASVLELLPATAR